MEDKQFNDAVRERKENFIKDMGSADTLMLDDLLNDYCRVCVMLDEVINRVRHEGTTLVNNKGRIERNPEVMTMHQMINEKNALFPKLMRFWNGEGDDEGDPLEQFIRA